MGEKVYLTGHVLDRSYNKTLLGITVSCGNIETARILTWPPSSVLTWAPPTPVWESSRTLLLLPRERDWSVQKDILLSNSSFLPVTVMCLYGIMGPIDYFHVREEKIFAVQ